tara:strand:+ start:84 stop:239 length:156 start_codon:yes stop_codon:yes gene_type:complete
MDVVWNDGYVGKLLKTRQRWFGVESMKKRPVRREKIYIAVIFVGGVAYGED